MTAATPSRPASWRRFCLASLDQTLIACTKRPGHKGDHEWEADRWERFVEMRAKELRS